MENIGILGFGPVGYATLERIYSVYGQGSTRPNIVFHDTDYSKVRGKKRASSQNLEWLFVCIGLGADETKSPRLAATAIINAIEGSTFRSSVTFSTNIILRSTVPPGTADELSHLTDHRVWSLPEFATEKQLDRGYSLTKVLGVPGNVSSPAYALPYRLCYGSTTTTKMAEFAKLAYNVRRASHIATLNELVHRAARLGVKPQDAEAWLVDNVDDDLFYSSFMFGGRCLEKDLLIWSANTRTTYGEDIVRSNLQEVGMLCDMIRDARYYGDFDSLHELHLCVVGLENAPGSQCTTNSPAEKFLQHQDVAVSWSVCDSKAVTEKYLSKIDVYGRKNIADPSRVNLIVVAQRDEHLRIPFNHLVKVVRASDAPVKMIINACNGDVTDTEVEMLLRHGGVFVDAQEVNYLASQAALSNPGPAWPPLTSDKDSE